MKTLKQHIFEKLKVSAKNTTKHTLFPETKIELKEMIEDEIFENGNECSLNHINVSKITNMSNLFRYSKFNGDISEWNVSNAKTMEGMFWGSNFNGDISNWDVSNVTNMYCMFYDSKFNGNISNWDVSSVRDMYGMFASSPLEDNPPKWYKR